MKGDVLIDASCSGAWVVLTERDSYFVEHVSVRYVIDCILTYQDVLKLLSNAVSTKYSPRILRWQSYPNPLFSKKIHPETNI